MSFLQSIVDGWSNLRADAGMPPPTDDFWYQPLGASRGNVAGVRVTAETSKRISTVYACCDRIASALITMPGKIFTDAPGGKKPVPTHPVQRLLSVAPNPRQTPADFFQQMQWWFELRGNAYAEIISGPRAAVQELRPMHPDRVQVGQVSNGNLTYKYNDPLTNQTRTLVQEEVFHLRRHSDDGITGVDTITAGGDVFGVAQAAQEYAGRFFANDGTPTGVIEGANFRSDEDESAFGRRWKMRQTGANRHSTAILPIGLTYKQISVTPEQAQLLEARKQSRIEIASMFGVPPFLVGEAEKAATYASVEQFAIMYVTYCLLARVIVWEQTIQRDLIADSEYYARFSMAALLRGDLAARYSSYMEAIQNGWLNPDEVRELEDRNAIPNGEGQQYFRSTNVVPLGQLTNEPADEADGVVEQESDDDSPSDPPPSSERMRAIALGQAERCVRKELAGAPKAADAAEFYAKHAQFVSEVLKVTAREARDYCDWACQIDPADFAGRVEMLMVFATGATA